MALRLYCVQLRSSGGRGYRVRGVQLRSASGVAMIFDDWLILGVLLGILALGWTVPLVMIIEDWRRDR